MKWKDHNTEFHLPEIGNTSIRNTFKAGHVCAPSIRRAYQLNSDNFSLSGSTFKGTNLCQQRSETLPGCPIQRESAAPMAETYSPDNDLSVAIGHTCDGALSEYDTRGVYALPNYSA